MQNIIGNTYTWNAGWIKFLDNEIVKTVWGDGFYKCLDDYIFEVSWNGFCYTINFNLFYTEYVSIRNIDLDLTKGILKSILYKPTVSNNSDVVFDNRKDMILHYLNTIVNPKILEIGIFKGEFFDFIADNCSTGFIDGVDLFEGIIYSANQDGNNGIMYNMEQSFVDLTEKYKDNPNVNLYKSDSSTYMKNKGDNFYDIIYIDGDHSYEGCKRDLIQAFQTIKHGGYIMGHDYEMNDKKANDQYELGVRPAVEEFCKKYNQQIIAKGMDGYVSFCIKVNKLS